jgi:hypothetical protein
MLLFGMMIVPVADVFSAFFVMGSFPDVTRAASNLRGLPLSDVGQPRLASPDYRTPLPYCPRYEPPPEAVPTDSMNGPPRLPRGTGSGAGAAGLRQFRLPGRGHGYLVRGGAGVGTGLGVMMEPECHLKIGEAAALGQTAEVDLGSR